MLTSELSAPIWEHTAGAFFADVSEISGQPRFHLVVERCDIGWTWVAWRPETRPDTRQHGFAATVHAAIREAEQVAARTD